MQVGRFFSWWGGELSGIVPRFLRGGSERRQRLGFELTESDVIVTLRKRARVIELGRFARAGGQAQALGGTLAARIGALNPAKTRVRVLLPKQLVLRKDLALPAAAEENLREVMSFEMDRQTPFRADDVYFNQAITARVPEKNQIKVTLHVVPRQVVEGALGLVKDWDLDPDAVEPSVDSASAKVEFFFAPAGYEPKRSTGLNAALVLVNVALVIGMVAVPLLQQRQQLAELRSTLDEARSAANAATQMQGQIEEQIAEARFLFDRKRADFLVVEILDELTERLPDGTWLRRLEMKDRDVNMDGESNAASSLIAQLESSPVLSNVRFAAPVTQDPRSGRERFRLAAQVGRRPPGEP